MIKLFSNSYCPNCHRTRIVLAEKELPIDTVEVEEDQIPQVLLDLNPYGTLPTIVDRDKVFFEATILNEYLDERYPHPPLKPGSPADRAQMRLAVMRIEQELYSLYFNLKKVRRKTEVLRKFRTYLESLDHHFSMQEYFIGECYTLADITMAPILWRLTPERIDTSNWKNLEGYMKRLFDRPSFQRALTENEQMMHH
ncbi:MAG: glutathione S-transferase N-terminal domain-containing protein [Mariprofundaceae bacterium]|nr:glutathione S-transferase N-terminal domain-containing protein [Mariprofundaceae bacterium]